MEQVSPELLKAALNDVLMAAQPFRHGRGMAEHRAALDAAMTNAGRAMSVATIEGVGTDYKTMRRLAEEADAEAAQRPGFRRDIDG